MHAAAPTFGELSTTLLEHPLQMLAVGAACQWPGPYFATVVGAILFSGISIGYKCASISWKLQNAADHTAHQQATIQKIKTAVVGLGLFTMACLDTGEQKPGMFVLLIRNAVVSIGTGALVHISAYLTFQRYASKPF
jgi:hypothetical protein